MNEKIEQEKEWANATLEAIYWWNRDESYYHKHFIKFEEIYEDEEVLEFFTTKIFSMFLREYSVRRNIKKGPKMVIEFIKELFEYNFIKRVKDGDINVVDDVSKSLTVGDTTNKKETKSLLSKIAFLINPHDFSLLDSLVKKSLWSIIKIDKINKIKHIQNYTGFIKHTDNQIKIHSNIIESQMALLDNFKNTDAYNFYKKNPKAFKRRIYDKYLWIKEQNKNSLDIDNTVYIDLHKMMNTI